MCLLVLERLVPGFEMVDAHTDSPPGCIDVSSSSLLLLAPSDIHLRSILVSLPRTSQTMSAPAEIKSCCVSGRASARPLESELAVLELIAQPTRHPLWYPQGKRADPARSPHLRRDSRGRQEGDRRLPHVGPLPPCVAARITLDCTLSFLHFQRHFRLRFAQRPPARWVSLSATRKPRVSR